MPPVQITEHHGKGIAWMLATGLCFICLDAIMKYLMESMPLVQVTWGRFFFGTVFAAVLAGRRLPQLVRSTSPGMQSLRSLFLMLTTGAFNAGIRVTPLATATTIMFLSPIIVTLLAIPLLGEKVGIRRWCGILIGFAGAIVVVRPWQSELASTATGLLLLLLAAFLNANYQVLTRMVRGDDPLTSLLFTATAGAIVTSCLLPWHWQHPTAFQWLLLAASGAAGGFGHFCLIRAFRLAPASVVSPFGYATLVWAILFGIVIWNDWPDGWTLAGAAMIIAAGLYIFSREQTLKTRAAKEASA